MGKTNGKFVYGKWDCGSKFMKVAKPPKAECSRQCGSHVIVTVLTGPYAGYSQPVPNHPLGKGLAYVLFKWFVKVGIIVLVTIPILCALGIF